MAFHPANETGAASPAARWRGVPVTELALLLAGPLLMGAVLAMGLFRLNLQAVRADYPPRVQSWLPTAFAVAYVLSALAMGRWLRPRGTTVVMLVAIVIALGAALLVPATHALGAMLMLAAALGVVAGGYFVAFQVNIQHVQPFHTLAWSIACFNVSWGLGEASGPALASAAGVLTAPMMAAILIALSALHAVVIVIASRSPRPAAEARAPAAFASTFRLRVVGWISIFLSTLVYVALIATLYPGLGHERSWSDERIALGVVILALPIALTSPLWARLRALLRGPTLLLLSLGGSAWPWRSCRGWSRTWRPRRRWRSRVWRWAARPSRRCITPTPIRTRPGAAWGSTKRRRGSGRCSGP